MNIDVNFPSLSLYRDSSARLYRDYVMYCLSFVPSLRTLALLSLWCGVALDHCMLGFNRQTRGLLEGVSLYAISVTLVPGGSCLLLAPIVGPARL